MSGGAGILNPHEKHLGFETEQEAAYLSLMIITAAADTVGVLSLTYPAVALTDFSTDQDVHNVVTGGDDELS